MAHSLCIDVCCSVPFIAQAMGNKRYTTANSYTQAVVYRLLPIAWAINGTLQIYGTRARLIVQRALFGQLAVFPS